MLGYAEFRAIVEREFKEYLPEEFKELESKRTITGCL